MAVKVEAVELVNISKTSNHTNPSDLSPATEPPVTTVAQAKPTKPMTNNVTRTLYFFMHARMTTAMQTSVATTANTSIENPFHWRAEKLWRSEESDAAPFPPLLESAEARLPGPPSIGGDAWGPRGSRSVRRRPRRFGGARARRRRRTRRAGSGWSAGSCSGMPGMGGISSPHAGHFSIPTSTSAPQALQRLLKFASAGLKHMSSSFLAFSSAGLELVAFASISAGRKAPAWASCRARRPARR